MEWLNSSLGFKQNYGKNKNIKSSEDEIDDLI